jgi:hypothetical protein
MNASQITHGLKTLGLGQSMLLGVAVFAVLTTCAYANRERILDGLFGSDRSRRL